MLVRECTTVILVLPVVVPRPLTPNLRTTDRFWVLSTPNNLKSAACRKFLKLFFFFFKWWHSIPAHMYCPSTYVLRGLFISELLTWCSFEGSALSKDCAYSRKYVITLRTRRLALQRHNYYRHIQKSTISVKTDCMINLQKLTPQTYMSSFNHIWEKSHTCMVLYPGRGKLHHEP